MPSMGSCERLLTHWIFTGKQSHEAVGMAETPQWQGVKEKFKIQR